MAIVMQDRQQYRVFHPKSWHHPSRTSANDRRGFFLPILSDFRTLTSLMFAKDISYCFKFFVYIQNG